MTEKKSFENNLQELEEIISKMEQGNVSLDEAIALFQKGTLLSQECNELLQNVHKEIELLKIENNELVSKEVRLKNDK